MSILLEKPAAPSNVTLTIGPTQCPTDFRDTVADLIDEILYSGQPFQASITDLLGRVRSGLVHQFDDIEGRIFIEDTHLGHIVVAVDDISRIDVH